MAKRRSVKKVSKKAERAISKISLILAEVPEKEREFVLKQAKSMVDAGFALLRGLRGLYKNL